MQFWKVLPKLKEGAAIRRACWEPCKYITHPDPECLEQIEVVSPGKSRKRVWKPTQEQITATDWELHNG